MKKLLLLLCLAFLTITIYAQSETLFSNFSISGFGGPTFSVSELNGEIVYLGGGGGGVIIGDFFIGGFGEGGTLNNTILDNDNYSIDLGYGGLWMGYSIMGRKAIHPFLGLKWATGESTIEQITDDRSTTIDNIQVLQPEVGLEFNFTRWMRLVAQVGYRNVIGVSNINILDNRQLSGVSGGITLRFGFFR